MPLRPPPEDRRPADLLEFGVVTLDKPPGPSSHQVSAWVRDLAGVDKASHAGTLDPKVTGCLPVLLGDATRLAGALLGEKEYIAVLELHDSPPTDLESVLDDFEGEIYQTPPRKSAVARERRVREIYELDLLEVEGRQALLRIRCESGTYIRKLCHDLGHLRRTATEPFDDTKLVTLHELADGLAWWRENDETETIRAVVDPGERALVHLPKVTITDGAADSVATGAPVYAPGVIGSEVDPEDEPLVACYTPEGSVVCLGRLVGDPTAKSGEAVDLERVLV